MVDTAASIWRDWELDGVPSSGKHKPRKSKIREWGTYVEAAALGSSAGAVVFPSKSTMDGTLTYAANTSAWVIGDSTPANNGIYRKSGSSGSGSWTRLGDLPYSFVRLVDVGAGAADAIELTSTLPTSTSAMRVANVFEANAGNVTISENGATAKPLLTSSGNQVAPGGLVAGAMIVYVDDGASFRLISDQASAAIVAAAEAAQAAAEEAYNDFILRYLGAHANDAAASAAAGGSPATGQLYWNTSESALKVWGGAAWGDATQPAAAVLVVAGVGDGVETDFTLDERAQLGNTIVAVGGLVQTAGYTLVDGALSFSEAPPLDVPYFALTVEAVPLGTTNAGLVSIADAGGHFDGSTVEDALQELAEGQADSIASGEVDSAIAAAITTHSNATTGMRRIWNWGFPNEYDLSDALTRIPGFDRDLYIPAAGMLRVTMKADIKHRYIDAGSPYGDNYPVGTGCRIAIRQAASQAGLSSASPSFIPYALGAGNITYSGHYLTVACAGVPFAINAAKYVRIEAWFTAHTDAGTMNGADGAAELNGGAMSDYNNITIEFEPDMTLASAL